ncbi:hypothetical protein LTR56_021771 [Elasticomyces elasticus]|nr:hypothetical protein LTR56_021771 [Elasticomyces elasticus]KAK3630527.1 hypothetical protein LTR22_021443 [Elasticomyces elasticus]KAK4909088.1 hypothetical protein LTR49_022128 [Elasticomyces elasticus]KAK5729810.1 hypothetical protein LTS12_027292 [Elasticomyces elasticus]
MAPKKVVKKEVSPLEIRELPTPAVDDANLRMSYRIARGEQGEPYKSYLLPHWRFKTIPIARASSKSLWEAFEYYVKAGDLVGADMARKFIQMGMTRAKRYANHKGGRKYDRSERELERDGGVRSELPRSEAHEGRDEKLGASEVFKEVWKRCTSNDSYLELKTEFLAEQKVWDREQKKKVKKEEKIVVKDEEEDD